MPQLTNHVKAGKGKKKGEVAQTQNFSKRTTVLTTYNFSLKKEKRKMDNFSFCSMSYCTVKKLLNSSQYSDSIADSLLIFFISVNCKVDLDAQTIHQTRGQYHPIPTALQQAQEWKLESRSMDLYMHLAAAPSTYNTTTLLMFRIRDVHSLNGKSSCITKHYFHSHPVFLHFKTQ